MGFEQKILQFITQFHLLKAGTGVLIGLSGGADSTALLDVLVTLREQLGLQIAALHIHHGIRSEAEQDAEFCRQLCFEKDVPCYVEYVDVTDYAKSHGTGLEEAGRIIRYQLFESYRQKLQLDVIAVAHHQNDQAETVLFQLFRGSGLRGLSGMRPQNDRIIRPLLSVSRNEIEAHLRKKNIEFVTDASNLTDDYSRNKIRNHMLPMAEDISGGAISKIYGASMQLREVHDYMEIQAREFLDKNAVCENGHISVTTESLKKTHPALQKMIIMEAVSKCFKSRKDVTEKHILSILSLLDKNGEKVIHLPNGGQVLKRYDELLFRLSENEIFPEEKIRIPIIPNETYYLQDGTKIETEVFLRNNLENIPQNDCTKWLDYDKINSQLLLRTREQGDYLTVRDDGATKSLQDYFINEKVLKAERDQILLLADGHHIMWVLGKRISAYYKVTDQTKHILQIHVGGREDG